MCMSIVIKKHHLSIPNECKYTQNCSADCATMKGQRLPAVTWIYTEIGAATTQTKGRIMLMRTTLFDVLSNRIGNQSGGRRCIV